MVPREEPLPIVSWGGLRINSTDSSLKLIGSHTCPSGQTTSGIAQRVAGDAGLAAIAKAVEVGEDRGCLPERNLAEVAAGLGLRCAVKLCAELFRQRHI